MIVAIQLPASVVSRIEIAGPGFINFWLADDQLAGTSRHDHRSGSGAMAAPPMGAGRKVNVEFVSANPTGPLHVGHGRGAALGDGIAALLEWTGHSVTREFYINDAGVQIDRLGAQSLGPGPAAAREDRREFPRAAITGNTLWRPREQAVQREEAARRGPARGGGPARGPGRSRSLSSAKSRTSCCRDFGVRFDVITRSRRCTTRAGSTPPRSTSWPATGLTYEKDGALWLRTTALRRRQGPGAPQE